MNKIKIFLLGMVAIMGLAFFVTTSDVEAANNGYGFHRDGTPATYTSFNNERNAAIGEVNFFATQGRLTYVRSQEIINNMRRTGSMGTVNYYLDIARDEANSFYPIVDNLSVLKQKSVYEIIKWRNYGRILPIMADTMISIINYSNTTFEINSYMNGWRTSYGYGL